MIVYRICKSKYRDDISGNGSKLYGSRWNNAGIPLLYTTEHISLAALEMLVHITFDEIPTQFHLMHIKIPDNSPIVELKHGKLKKLWEEDEEYTAWIGSEFIKGKKSICMIVPSAIIAEENNYLLNPLHPDYKKIQIAQARPFNFDKRLLHP